MHVVRSATERQAGERPRDSKLVKACCEMSRRDGAIVAWHEVPGAAPPQKSSPVGYGGFAQVGTDSMIGVTTFRNSILSAV